MTGAAGFVGSAIVRRFVDGGASVASLVRPGGDSRRLDGVCTDIHECDFEDASSRRHTLLEISPDIVVHCAVAAGHPVDDETTQRAWSVNVSATVGLLDVMTDLPGSRLIHFGSSLEYAPSPEPLSESSPCEPITIRGASKLAATVAVRRWCAENIRHGVVLRPFSVYGPRQQPERLIPTLFRCAHNGEPFPNLDGTSRRDFVWVDDVTDACVRAISVASPRCPIVNIGTGAEHSVTDVLRAVEAVTGKTINVCESERIRQAHDVEHWSADISLCKETFRWAPPTTLAQGLAMMAGGA